MDGKNLTAIFAEAAIKVGATINPCADLAGALEYICRNAGGAILFPSFPSGNRLGLKDRLQAGGCEIIGDNFRHPRQVAAGLTGANFALAATGSVVLESTSETVRLATTLPDRHFVLLDPRKIVVDELAAAPLLRDLHRLAPRNFVAYITGPSRTADIERVLTIGVHGPRELHILLVDGLSEDPMEM